MRVVFDTNIFISAFVFPRSVATRAVQKILDGEDALIISRAIVDELLSTLAKKFSRDPEQLSRIAIFLSDLAELIQPHRSLDVFQDEPDNRILECAVEGRADLIVTGDKKILQKRAYQDIRFISLKQYLE